MHQHWCGMPWRALLKTAWKILVPVHIMGYHHCRSCWKLILRLAEHIIQYLQKSGVWQVVKCKKSLVVAIIFVQLYICCAIEATNIQEN